MHNGKADQPPQAVAKGPPVGLVVTPWNSSANPSAVTAAVPEAARAVLKAAYASHSISFGPGVRLFARRYEADLLLPPEAPEELLITLVT